MSSCSNGIWRATHRRLSGAKLRRTERAYKIASVEQPTIGLLSGTFCITRCATNKFYVQKHPNSAPASTTDFFGKRSASRAPPHLHRCGGRVLRLEPVWRPAGPSDFAFCSASHSRRAVLAASSASITTDCNLSSETHLPYPVASIALRAAFMAASSSRCNILSSLYDGSPDQTDPRQCFQEMVGHIDLPPSEP
jgi:hypothetical protein